MIPCATDDQDRASDFDLRAEEKAASPRGF